MTALPDLTAARSVVEGAFVDVCRIERDTAGPRDDVFNRTTLQLEPPVSDSTTIYGPGLTLDGKCFIRELSSVQGEHRSEGARDVDRQRWRLRLPVSAPVIKTGDVVVMVSSVNDATLVDRRLTVVQVSGSTLAVSRIALLQDESGTTRV